MGQQGKKVAPPKDYRNGLRSRALCEKCNSDTQNWYNASLKDWTDQARVAVPANADTDYVDVDFQQIEQLAVVKQVLVGALAASDFSPAPEAA